MLKKNDITGFEQEYIWVDLTNNKFYQFYMDGTGVMTDNNEESHPVRWEYIDDKSALKIGYNGSIFYYIFKEQDKDIFKVVFKSKSKSADILLSRVVKGNETPITSTDKEEVNENGELVKEKFAFNKLDAADKVFFIFMFTVSFLLFAVLLKMAIFFNGLSILLTFFIAFISTTLLFVYLKDVLYFVSRKYKKEIEDIIFKK